MANIYRFHEIETAPRRWREAGEAIASTLGTGLYGIWRSQIGRPRDFLTAISTGDDSPDLAGTPYVLGARMRRMQPTLRPADATPPARQGNYAFRTFLTPEPDWQQFLALCAAAWPGFESHYDSLVIGLWRFDDAPAGQAASLLLTRRPDLAMWERSKLPASESEDQVRRLLSRRYDLCDWTEVYTTTLLTALDQVDTVRWA